MKRFCSIIALLLALCLLPFSVVADEQEPGVEDFRQRIGVQTILAALYEEDIPTLRKALDLKLVSCQELTQFYLDRIEAYNDDYNVFISMCTDALDKAKACDQAIASGKASGELFGIPVVIKDNYHLKGYYMTNGHAFADSEISTVTSQVVQYLLKEGAIILGKVNMSTEAEAVLLTDSEVIGNTLGAYNPLISPGGSSGGSAVATSLNFAPVSLGTDTNASLRYPATLAGCVSMRVTHGKLSLDGIKRLNRTRDVPGPITKTVYEQALVLDALSGGKTNYAGKLNGDAMQGVRLGILKELSYPNRSNYLYTEANIDDEITAAFSNAVKELESLGAQIVEVSIPDLFTLNTATIELNDSASKLAMYNTVRSAMKEADVQALIFPTYLHSPLMHGRDENGKYWNVYSQTPLINCLLSPSTCMPEISVPIGYHSRGAGIGMEFAALKNQEQLLLDLAYTYTNHYYHRKTPEGAPNLYEATMTMEEIFQAYEAYLADTAQLPQLAQTDLPLSQFPITVAAWQEFTQKLPQLAQTTISIRDCVGLPEVETVPGDPESEKLPDWVLPAGVGALAVLLLAVILLAARISAKKKRARKKRKKPDLSNLRT